MATNNKLLIIDDEEVVIKSCLRILRDTGLVIDTASSGEEGLEKIKKNHYNIVLTDLMMPGIGGMEVLKTIKKEKADIIVIIFTGYATVETAREALKSGAFDYIPKPFTPDEFRKVMNNALAVQAENSDSNMLDLMAIVSHEMKSPVSAMQTTAETLYRGYFGKLDPKHEKKVESIIRNCQYLEDIMRSYIDLSKMELDGMETFKKEINLFEDVVQPVLAIPEYLENLKQMRFNTSNDYEGTVPGDPNLLKIVVTNYVNNAIKYGKENTVIDINLSKSNGVVIFSVRNSGVGFSNENMADKLFQKFSRLKQDGTAGVKGSGLGLYICKKIIEKHGGSVWAESEEGSWAQFYFSLPL